MKQLYPGEPRGNLARHLETLVFMISGIIGSKSCQLPKIASRAPGSVHPDSRTKQFSRWVQNENVTFDLYFLPFVGPLLEQLAAVRPLVLIMDGSAVARGCVTLMVCQQRNRTSADHRVKLSPDHRAKCPLEFFNVWSSAVNLTSC